MVVFIFKHTLGNSEYLLSVLLSGMYFSQGTVGNHPIFLPLLFELNYLN